MLHFVEIVPTNNFTPRPPTPSWLPLSCSWVRCGNRSYQFQRFTQACFEFHPDDHQLRFHPQSFNLGRSPRLTNLFSCYVLSLLYYYSFLLRFLGLSNILFYFLLLSYFITYHSGSTIISIFLWMSFTLSSWPLACVFYLFLRVPSINLLFLR